MPINHLVDIIGTVLNAEALKSFRRQWFFVKSSYGIGQVDVAWTIKPIVTSFLLHDQHRWILISTKAGCCNKVFILPFTYKLFLFGYGYTFFYSSEIKYGSDDNLIRKSGQSSYSVGRSVFSSSFFVLLVILLLYFIFMFVYIWETGMEARWARSRGEETGLLSKREPW